MRWPIVPRVAMLLPLRFLEGRERADIIDGGRLARVHVFINRIPMMHRHDWQGPRATNAHAYAWFIWDRDHKGPAEVHRIECKKKMTNIEQLTRELELETERNRRARLAEKIATMMIKAARPKPPPCVQWRSQNRCQNRGGCLWAIYAEYFEADEPPRDGLAHRRR